MRTVALAVAATFLLTATVAAKEDTAMVLSGEVAIDTTSTGEILVALDVHPADGIADYELVLQQEEPFERVSAHLDTARVMVRDDQIRVRGSRESGVALLLLLRGAKPRLTGPPDQWQVIEGFGLSRSWGGGLGLPVDVVASESHYRQGELWLKDGPPEGPEGGSGAGCTAGGPGANHCSITCEGNPSQCSVSCNAPKYACCFCDSLVPRSKCKCHP